MDSGEESTQPNAESQQASESSASPQAELCPSIAAPSPTNEPKQHGYTKPQLTPRQSRLLSSNATLKSNISKTEAQLSTKLLEITQLKSFPSSQQQPEHTNQDPNRAALAHAQTIINKHISLMKRYNEIKDIAMGMLGLIADKEGKRVAEVMEERQVSEKD